MTPYDFSPLFRASVGFDRLANLLQDSVGLSEAGNGYPPYNIEKSGEDQYRITLAVAGFTQDELSITTQDNTLVIEGHRRDANADTRYLHRGIAARSFRRQFQLADYIEVVGGNLSNGLLTIDLVRKVPEAMKPRRIEIETSPPKDVGKSKPKLIEGEKKAA